GNHWSVSSSNSESSVLEPAIACVSTASMFPCIRANLTLVLGVRPPVVRPAIAPSTRRTKAMAFPSAGSHPGPFESVHAAISLLTTARSCFGTTRAPEEGEASLAPTGQAPGLPALHALPDAGD